MSFMQFRRTISNLLSEKKNVFHKERQTMDMKESTIEESRKGRISNNDFKSPYD